jgi:threonine/homoserine/homoserine lactone efflux protein
VQWAGASNVLCHKPNVSGTGQYLAFIGVSLIVICTPGQDTALTIRNTLLGQRPAGVATAFGVSLGQAVWTLATSAGLAVVLTASAPVFAAVKFAGAAYLTYLGVRSLLGAARASVNAIPATNAGPRLSAAAAFQQGFISNISNAKMVAFFTGLLPQFAGPNPTFLLLLVLGINFSLLTLAWLIGYTFAVERLSGVLRRASVRRGMDALLGTVLIGLGVRLGAESLRP